MADEQKAKLGLHNLPQPKGAVREGKRKGRGPGSGLGKTGGRGHKGQGSRASGNVRPGFEGGQMPLLRRLPKRGFHNPARVAAQVVNVRDLAKLEGTEVSPGALLAGGLVSRVTDPVKILAVGTVERAYTVTGCLCSAGARQKIEAAGGSIEA